MAEDTAHVCAETQEGCRFLGFVFGYSVLRVFRCLFHLCCKISLFFGFLSRLLVFLRTALMFAHARQASLSLWGWIILSSLLLLLLQISTMGLVDIIIAITIIITTGQPIIYYHNLEFNSWVHHIILLRRDRPNVCARPSGLQPSGRAAGCSV